MKFAEHLLAHITPEWRRQYIVYEDMKTMLYEAVENIPTIETANPMEISRLIRAFDEDFMAFCEKELFKINVFYEEKLAEAKRKFDALRKEMDALAIEYQQGHGRRQSYLRSSISRLVVSTGGLLHGVSGVDHHYSGPPESAFKSTINLRQRQSMLSRRSPSQGSQLIPSIDSSLPRHSTPACTDYGTISGGGLSGTDSSPATDDTNTGDDWQPQAPALSVHFKTRPTRPTMSYGNNATTISSHKLNAHHQLQLQYQQHLNQTNDGGLSSLPGVDKKKLNDIKLAFSEFYLSLVLLQNYQRLNFTGFRKILKKHDKLIGNEEGKRWHHSHVESAFFHTNKDVDKLIEETENIVTYHLEAGDRQRAMKKLRVPPLNDAPQPWTAFRVGFYLGAFIVLLATVALTGIFQQTGEDWRIVFRLYRSSLFIIFFIFLVGINIYGWRAHGVNHVLIFELDPRDHLGCQDLLEIAFSFGLLWCISVLFFLWSGPLGIPPLINPVILNAILIIYLFNPTKTFHHSARFWLIRCMARIVTAPFHKIRFSDFWLADQLNSLVPVLLDIEYTSCFYLSSTDLYGNVDLDRCMVRDPKDLLLRSIVACLPAWWRFVQCVRRYFDEGRRANPHLLNAGKYSTVWLVVLFSTLTEYNQDNYFIPTANPFFVCWIMSLIVGSTYTYAWDIKMDWGLFDPKAPKEYKFLREELVYPVKYYYAAIFFDLLLRFGWTLNLSLTEVGAIPPDLITLVLAPCEVFRRFLWNFYRLENEHLNNCGEFRAVRDISISGQNIDMSALNRILRIMDEPDGLTAFRSKVKAKLMSAKKKSLAGVNTGGEPPVVLII